MGEAPRFAPAAGLPLWEKNTRVFPSPKLQRADPDLVPQIELASPATMSSTRSYRAWQAPIDAIDPGPFRRNIGVRPHNCCGGGCSAQPRTAECVGARELI